MTESAEEFAKRTAGCLRSLQEGYLKVVLTNELWERDATIVRLCADALAERGHHHAANSLRKMLREGRLLP